MPELSVIIATFNRAERLRCCLDALGGQSLAHSHFEVVVVVDGAKDTTMAMLVSLEPPFRLRVVWQENSGQAAALNRGIAEADGRFCLFLDNESMCPSPPPTNQRERLVASGCSVPVGDRHLSVF